MATNDDIFEFKPDLDGTALRIGIVVGRFNQDIGDGLLSACAAELRKLGVASGDIEIVTVPGALEIPLALQKLASTGRFDALVALGAVIRGETYHFEVVSNQSADGVMTVQLDTGVPIANGILTTDNDEQAEARMNEKGADCARVAIEMANLMQAIDQWLLNESAAETLLAQLQEQKEYPKADQPLAEALLRGVIGNADALRQLLTPYLDREVKGLSPVEHALLLLSAFELRDHPQTPYKVIINEAIELAKSFGGTDGHKYVNGVLDKLAAELRPDEVNARNAARVR